MRSEFTHLPDLGTLSQTSLTVTSQTSDLLGFGVAVSASQGTTSSLLVRDLVQLLNLGLYELFPPACCCPARIIRAALLVFEINSFNRCRQLVSQFHTNPNQKLHSKTLAGSNTDGCDPDSSWNVYIADNTFSTGDDCIAIKARLQGPAWPAGPGAAGLGPSHSYSIPPSTMG